MSKESKIKDRMMGCLVGLAVGDAYGTTWEFTDKFRMPSEDELSDYIIGDGPFKLNPGDWTDDTSMALCLAESLIEEGWEPDDQMDRYIKWWKEGYNSVKGYCFDIGMSTRSALRWYEKNGGEQFIQDDQAAGNGVLMRLAPIPMMYFEEDDSIHTVSKCAFQSIMTHPSSQSIETSMLLGGIISNIFRGERDKRKIVNFHLFDGSTLDVYEHFCEDYACKKNLRIEDIKNRAYEGLDHDKISGSGYCVHTLEAALWAFVSTDSFMEGLKKVVSLGEDTDTTGAVYGQIAGAYYGLKQIPHRDKITWSDKIHNLAERLYELNATTMRKVSKREVLSLIEAESGYVIGEEYEGKGIYIGIIDEYPHGVDYFNRQHHFRVPTGERGQPSIINTVLIKKIKRESV